MHSISFVLLTLAINGGFTDARRVNKNAQQKMGDADTEGLQPPPGHQIHDLGQGGASLVGATPQQHLNAFLTWATSGKTGAAPEYAEFIGPLLQGIIDNDSVDAITWTEPDAAFTEAGGLNDQHGHLKIELKVPKLYGEVSSQSRVPIAWTLDKDVTFTFKKAGDGDATTYTADVTGLGTLTSNQALKLFDALAKSTECRDTEGCNPAECKIDMAIPEMPPCLIAEISAAEKYLTNNWKKGAKIKDQKGKVTEVLHTSYGQTMYYYAAKGKWGNIYYALISASNLKVTSFVVNPDHKLYATSVAQPAAEGAAYSRAQKAELMGAGQIKGNAALMSVAIKAAKSGMNIAMLLAHGNDAIRHQLEEIGLPAADPSSIGSNLTPCDNSIELGKCKGSVPGRLHWTEDVPASMK